MKFSVKLENPFIASSAALLWQGVELMQNLSDEVFAANGRGSVGAHFRHCLDFITNFLNGVETGSIDYNHRERDRQVEQDREYAVSRFMFAIGQLQDLLHIDLDKAVLVKLETHDIWCQSSVLREVEYLNSHTTHHYALIALKLRQQGFSINDNFGVAPSTLEFWQQEFTKTKAA